METLYNKRVYSTGDIYSPNMSALCMAISAKRKRILVSNRQAQRRLRHRAFKQASYTDSYQAGASQQSQLSTRATPNANE